MRRLRRRLIVALVFFVPLTDLSVMLSLFPWSAVPRLAVGAGGAGRAGGDLGGVAVPPGRAASNARHGPSSMDTLVSLGIIAACGWSVYAMFVLDRGQAGLERPGSCCCTPPAAASTWRSPRR